MSDSVRPERIQRKRSKGWQMPSGVVYVGRPTKWGNPFTTTPDDTLVERQQVVANYRDWLKHPHRAELVADIKRELRGKHLACWCLPGVPCHVDVLLEIANA